MQGKHPIAYSLWLSICLLMFLLWNKASRYSDAHWRFVSYSLCLWRLRGGMAVVPAATFLRALQVIHCFFLVATFNPLRRVLFCWACAFVKPPLTLSSYPLFSFRQPGGRGWWIGDVLEHKGSTDHPFQAHR
jgi:hypothetical protein